MKSETAQLLADRLYMSGYRPRYLLSQGNAKLMKSERTIGLSLSPARTSGYEVCAFGRHTVATNETLNRMKGEQE